MVDYGRLIPTAEKSLSAHQINQSGRHDHAGCVCQIQNPSKSAFEDYYSTLFLILSGARCVAVIEKKTGCTID
jgi:hypothetical protein